MKPRTLAEIAAGPATVGIGQACVDLGISKPFGYELVRRGEFPCQVLRLGDRCRVVSASLHQLLSGQAAAGLAAVPPEPARTSPNTMASRRFARGGGGDHAASA